MRSSMRMTSEKIQDWKDEIRLFCWGVFAIACYLAWRVVSFLRLGTYKVQQLWPAFTTCYWRFRDFRHGVEDCGRCYNEFQMREAEADIALELSAEIYIAECDKVYLSFGADGIRKIDDYEADVDAALEHAAELAEMPDDPRW